MVGAILTGAKIAGSLLGNLLSKKSAAQSTPANPQTPYSGPVQAQQIALSPDVVRREPAAPNLLGSLGNVLQMATPLMAKAGAPAINGLGGIAQSLLSTLNDDEWFEHYDGNGATFNELLKADAAKISATKFEVRPYGAMALYDVEINSSGRFWNGFMPQVLAYVRSKTNNILQDNTDQYQLAFYALTMLYSIMYSLKKYYQFVLNTPSNAPTVISAFSLFRPENLNATAGIITSLESYLKSTAKLPYAFTSYLRWRYGTLFLSANTKRAGFVSYDPYTVGLYTAVNSTTKDLSSADLTIKRLLHPNNTPNDTALNWKQFTPNELSVYIEKFKAVLVTTGRAAADMALAYQDHVVKYDVEERHYDEKEFCLRQNMGENFNGNAAASPATPTNLGRTIELIMDSRLDMNAAIQALTISTQPNSALGTGYVLCPFQIKGGYILVNFAEFYSSLSSNARAGFTLASGGNWYNEQSEDQWFSHDAPEFYSAVGYSYADLPNHGSTSTAANYAAQWGKNLAIAACNALELHINRSVRISMVGDSNNANACPDFEIMCAPLSYDRARISVEQLECIQRNAILNLVRGDYKNKKPVDVKEEATEVIDAMTSKDIKISESAR